jgi:multidrug efflux pump subunit AcrA (membrane-fusion protein)
MEEEVNLRSEDIEEILGTPPGWLIRWGTTVLVGCISLMLFAGWMIQYPDVITAKITISTAMPPVPIVANTNTYISRFLVKEGQAVQRGDVLVILQSSARYEDVMKLNKAVNAMLRAEIDSFPDLQPKTDLELGDLQGDYNLFLQYLSKISNKQQSNANVSAANKISTANRQITQLETSIKTDQQARDRLSRQLQQVRESVAVFEKQFEEGLVPRLRLEQERTQLYDIERRYDDIEENINRRKNEIFNLRNSIGAVRFITPTGEPGAEQRLLESLNILRANLDKWKKTYLLTAPTEGRISLNTSFYSDQQHVSEGDQVLAVVPPEDGKIVGRLALPIAGSGKVRPKQRVVIRLESYPHYEFGALEGIIETKSLASNNNQYAILVALPKGLKTQYGRTINFEQQLQGEADIITEERRFLQRIVDQLFVRPR